MIEIQDEVKLTNENGVMINAKDCGHWAAGNATCECGESLIVAPAIFEPTHEPGDPVMVCGDHGVHGYRFKSLIVGQQPEGSANGGSDDKNS